jgi:hypothetical protein
MSMGGFFKVPCALLLLASPSFASISFTTTNNPQPDEENILLNSGTSGTVVTGVTNQSGQTVQFSSTTDTLRIPSGGQARIEAVDGSLNNITISTLDGVTYMDFIGNPRRGSGNATVTVVTDVATYSFSYPLGNGQNYFTIIATDEQILTTTINAPGGFTDLRQPRISGVTEEEDTGGGDPTPGASAPEPATVLLLGLACASMAPFALKRRKAGNCA